MEDGNSVLEAKGVSLQVGRRLNTPGPALLSCVAWDKAVHLSAPLKMVVKCRRGICLSGY